VVDCKKEEPLDLLPVSMVTLGGAKRRRCGAANFCVLITALLIVVVGVIGGIYLYRHLTHRTFRGWCKVRYYETIEEDDDPYYGDAAQQSSYHHKNYHSNHQERIRHMGEFEEHLEIDRAEGRYEKIEVPSFEDVHRATVVHDFDKNLTAIVDKDNHNCFILPLNRSVISLPSDLWDLLKKARNGYYMPDMEVIREKYQITFPRIRNVSELGYFVWIECRRYDTYHLQKVPLDMPVAMVKRSVDEKNSVDTARREKYVISGSTDKILFVQLV